MAQEKLDRFDYKFGFNFARKHFPNCLAKAPLDEANYLVLDYYRPRKKNLAPGWYVAIRGYGSPRPKQYLRHVQTEANVPISYTTAKTVFLETYHQLNVDPILN